MHLKPLIFLYFPGPYEKLNKILLINVFFSLPLRILFVTRGSGFFFLIAKARNPYRSFLQEWLCARGLNIRNKFPVSLNISYSVRDWICLNVTQCNQTLSFKIFVLFNCACVLNIWCLSGVNDKLENYLECYSQILMLLSQQRLSGIFISQMSITFRPKKGHTCKQRNT